MCRLRFMMPLLVVGFLAGGFLLGEDKKTDSKEPVFVKTQLPRYYRQLGLSDKQKKSIYKIRYAYALKLAELQRQLKELRAKEKDELESVLTAGQKTRLRELTPVRPSKVKEKENEVKDKAVEAKKK